MTDYGSPKELLCPDCGHHLHRPKPGICGWHDCGCPATPKQPATAAGRWLLAHVKPDYTPPESGKDFRGHILAIEAEAVQDYEDDRRLILAIEAEAVALDVDVLAEALLRVGDAMQLAATFEAMAEMLRDEYARLMRERQP